MSTTSVTSGQTSVGLVENNGDTVVVYNGGSVVADTVNGGGTEYLSGGTAFGTTVNINGTQTIYTGSSVDARIGAGTENVYGGVAYSSYITGDANDGVGGIQNIYSGGVASGTTLFDSVTENVYSGGLAVDTTVNFVAFINVFNGGETSGATVEGRYASETVFSGGNAIDTTITSGDTLYVNSGGLTSDDVISGGSGEVVNSGAVDSGSTIYGNQVVQGTSDNAIVIGGGTQYVEGTATNTDVLSGGAQYVYNSAAFTYVGDGGREVVYGSAQNSFVDSGGSETDYGSETGAYIATGGSETVEYGTLTDGTLAGGTLEIGYYGAATLSSVASGTIIFNDYGYGGTLAITTSDDGAIVFGLDTADKVDLQSLAYGGNHTGTVDASGDLIVSEGGASQTIHFDSSFVGDTFLFTDDGNGGTAVELECFLADTRILTTVGEVAVQDLTSEHFLKTISGRDLQVKWLGRSLALAGSEGQHAPIRIAKGALGEGIPSRDLFVSPGHSLFVQKVFVPAELLVNGTTITKSQHKPSYAYYHVEVAPHSVIFAEGAPTESYLDIGTRRHYLEVGAVGSEYLPEPKTWEDAAARLVLAGPTLQKIRDEIDERAVRLLRDEYPHQQAAA